jgi:dihydropteroate synthase
VVVNNKPAEIPPVFLCGRYTREYSRQPLIMGIVNVTPDSFSDGGAFFRPSLDPQQAIAYALQLIGEGADILDIGGESTRPGSMPISPQQEMDRVLPVIEGLLEAGVPLSIDTRRPEVMEAAIALGVDIINDINGFRDPRAFRLATNSRCGLCVMHMLGEPQTMQVNPTYEDVVAEVWGFLQTQRDGLIAQGVDPGRIVLDPGFGFGKTLHHNLELLRSIGAISAR